MLYIDAASSPSSVPIAKQCVLQERLRKRIESAKIKVLNSPRQGKKVVVLDIDYTIFDLNSTAGTASY